MGHRRTRPDQTSTPRLARRWVAAAAPFGLGRAASAPQLPSLSISDGTMVGDGEQIEFTVTLTGATEPTTTQPGTTTTQPAAELPATGSSVVPIVLVAAVLIVA